MHVFRGINSCFCISKGGVFCYNAIVMKYVRRQIEQEIVERLDSGKINVIYGPRQSGKTTMVRHIVESQGLDATWLDADMLDVREMLADMTPAKWKSIIGGHGLLVVDEAQRVEGIGIALKILADNVKDARVVVTGSSSLDLRRRMDEPLTGRKFEYVLLPPSFSELADGNVLSERRNLEDRLVYGSYPEVIASSGDRDKILSMLASSYLYRDLLAIDGIAKSSVLDKLIRALAFQIGQEVSFAELGSLVGIDRKTVEKYIDLLKKSFVVFELPAYSGNQRNEIKKTRKIYFHDVGIRNAVIGNLLPLSVRPLEEIGHLWENYLISERLKRNVNRPFPPRMFFWRTRTQQEVDYIEEEASGMSAWEMKWSDDKVRGNLPAAFTTAYPKSRTGFVSRGNVEDFLV